MLEERSVWATAYPRYHKPDITVDICQWIEAGVRVARNQRTDPAIGARAMSGDEQLAVPIGGIEWKEQ